VAAARVAQTLAAPPLRHGRDGPSFRRGERVENGDEWRGAIVALEPDTIASPVPFEGEAN